MMLDPLERSALLEQFPSKPGSQMDEVDPSYLRLTADQYRVVGDWRAFAILGLTEIPGFKRDSSWIGQRLSFRE